jgi:hypothetical protein
VGRWTLAGVIGAIVVLIGGFSQAGNEGRIEPLDGMHSLGVPSTGKEHRPAQPRVDPNDAGRPPAGTPFGEPLAPSHLTPPPVLPFNPNRALMPSPSSPSPFAPGFSGGGRAGR